MKDLPTAQAKSEKTSSSTAGQIRDGVAGKYLGMASGSVKYLRYVLFAVFVGRPRGAGAWHLP